MIIKNTIIGFLVFFNLIRAGTILYINEFLQNETNPEIFKNLSSALLILKTSNISANISIEFLANYTLKEKIYLSKSMNLYG